MLDARDTERQAQSSERDDEEKQRLQYVYESANRGILRGLREQC